MKGGAGELELMRRRFSSRWRCRKSRSRGSSSSSGAAQHLHLHFQKCNKEIVVNCRTFELPLDVLQLLQYCSAFGSL